MSSSYSTGIAGKEYSVLFGSAIEYDLRRALEMEHICPVGG